MNVNITANITTFQSEILQSSVKQRGQNFSNKHWNLQTTTKNCWL